jgi:hypothetical protein
MGSYIYLMCTMCLPRGIHTAVMKQKVFAICITVATLPSTSIRPRSKTNDKVKLSSKHDI